MFVTLALTSLVTFKAVTTIARAAAGLNISGLGFVEESTAVLGLLGEVLGLLVAIFGVYAAVVVVLEPARFGRSAG